MRWASALSIWVRAPENSSGPAPSTSSIRASGTPASARALIRIRSITAFAS